MDRKFILFVGDNRTGKTTCCQILQDLIIRGFRKDCVTLTFSDPLREELINLYGLPRELVFDRSINKETTMIKLGDYPYDKAIPPLWHMYKLIKDPSLFKDKIVSLRELLIHHGTNIRRKQDTNYWVNEFDNLVDKYPNSEYILCDDTRFESEFNYFKDKDTSIFHLINGQEILKDKAQAAFHQWLKSNKDSVSLTIEVPIPLLKYYIDKFMRANIIPTIPGLRSNPVNVSQGRFLSLK